MMSFLYFLITIGVAIVVTWLVSQPGLEFLQRLRRHITWRRFASAVRCTLNHLENSDWRPNVVIGLNSGVVPASILALNLRVPEIYFYELLPRYRDGQRYQEVAQDKHIDLSGKNVLIVDDQAYTGGSMDALYKHLIANAHADPQRVKRCALFEFRSGAGSPRLDIPAAGYVRGNVKRVPWVFSRDLEPFWSQRRP